ncbi:hypothetical protein E4U58_004659 [Claviceps cyperi]|nr:hypothetical protein E4U58_004659 [Claviceps cyperi]
MLKAAQIRGENPDYEKLATEKAKTRTTLVGFVAIIDPLRPEIPDVVSTLRGAGIRFSMLERAAPEIGTSSDNHEAEKQISSSSSTHPSRRGALVISGLELKGGQPDHPDRPPVDDSD